MASLDADARDLAQPNKDAPAHRYPPCPIPEYVLKVPARQKGKLRGENHCRRGTGAGCSRADPRLPPLQWWWPKSPQAHLVPTSRLYHWRYAGATCCRR